MKNRIAVLAAAVSAAMILCSASPESAFEMMPPPDYADFSPIIMTGTISSPLKEARMTDPFGWRFHPITNNLDFHYGLDLAADTGSPIYAVMSGKVRTAGFNKSYGQYVVIDHHNHFSTLYAHCSELTVSEGQEVKRGRQIALVGSTGAATGPHLHFEVRQNNLHFDPLWILGNGYVLTDVPSPEQKQQK